jgi:hypothetical protein
MTSHLDRRRLVVNIDDDRVARGGLTRFMAEEHPDLLVEETGFTQAAARGDWSDVDFVLIDLHEPYPYSRSDEFPGCDVIRSIRGGATNRGPWIAVVTGATLAPRDPIVINRLLDAGASFMILRRDVPSGFAQLFRPGGPNNQPLRETMAAAPEVGVPAGSPIQRLVEAARSIDYGNQRLRGGSAGRARRTLSDIARLTARGVGQRSEGDPLHDRSASHEQLIRILRRATREHPDDTR